MAKAQFVEELKPNDQVDSIFMVKSKRLMPFRDRPGQYLELILGDRTGIIDGRVWENAESIEPTVPEHQPAKVTGTVVVFQQKKQIRINFIQPCPLDAVELADLVRTADKDVEELAFRLLSLARSLSHPHLKALLLSFLEDDDFMEKFKQAPASLNLHHDWVGGLIEHTVAVVELAEQVCKLHPEVDRELLLTGAVLHDIGKIKEYRWLPDIEQTDEGRLIGHVVLGTEMVTDRMKQIDGFLEELALRLRHMILSHHGTAEFGAARVPMTVEAMALHLIENMDAQVQRFISKIEAERGSGAWTEWDRLLERRLFIGYGTEGTEGMEGTEGGSLP